jgi:hypothetical protein
MIRTITILCWLLASGIWAIPFVAAFIGCFFIASADWLERIRDHDRPA